MIVLHLNPNKNQSIGMIGLLVFSLALNYVTVRLCYAEGTPLFTLVAPGKSYKEGNLTCYELSTSGTLVTCTDSLPEGNRICIPDSEKDKLFSLKPKHLKHLFSMDSLNRAKILKSDPDKWAEELDKIQARVKQWEMDVGRTDTITPDTITPDTITPDTIKFLELAKATATAMKSLSNGTQSSSCSRVSDSPTMTTGQKSGKARGKRDDPNSPPYTDKELSEMLPSPKPFPSPLPAD